ncbi:hypothetical conserved protein [Candidatus Nitrosoglobus terrae]|uniref:Hypothetical conserved protein n=1 Tax=Candidatus Nitrosoglobus terrae TaxID=1630141 RepID=A0A1Q2SLB6_9GAMM|nr:hypothetical protein [Candidatus Nitrosoglobus terrae]BAW79914.1 hypothetical conserved protein [Candidatus Nitrosoglobus terrae]
MKLPYLSIALAALVSFSLASFSVSAEETVAEKAEAKIKDTKRAAEQAADRAEEAKCTDGTIKCLGEKIKHRTGEAYDSVKDKSVELKHKMD